MPSYSVKNVVTAKCLVRYSFCVITTWLHALRLSAASKSTMKAKRTGGKSLHRFDLSPDNSGVPTPWSQLLESMNNQSITRHARRCQLNPSSRTSISKVFSNALLKAITYSSHVLLIVVKIFVNHHKKENSQLIFQP